VTYDLPLLPAALALALLYSHNMVWGLACGGASVVLASVLLHRENRLDLVVNRYVSRAKSSKILATPYELMRPERRDISVLFADLRGTTGISQELAPGEMLALLNEFHRRMIEEVARAGATVDKILGDGLMVLVGAPLRVDDHPARAVQLALAMQRRHRTWREERARDGQATPGMGIGVATGDVVIGNVGSELRLDYTAIGGEVNVASKICAVAEAGEVFVSRGCRSRVEEIIAAGRAPYLAGVRFEDYPPVTVRRLPRRLELVKVIFEDATARP
jgi:adenylate cyclase